LQILFYGLVHAVFILGERFVVPLKVPRNCNDSREPEFTPRARRTSVAMGSSA
jgi:hypothetical protein